VRIIALLTIPCALATAMIFAASRLVGDPKQPQPTQPATAVVWAGRVFVSRLDLADWLRSRGASYKEWLKHHPPLPPAPTQAPTQTVEPPSAPAAASPSGGEGSGSGLWWLLAAVAGGLGALALVYRRIRRRELRLPALPRLTIERGLPDASAPTRPPNVPRPALPRGSLLGAFEPAVRGAHRTTYYLLHRRSELVWIVATSALALALAVLLPHL
jgi:hypothetical protein